MSYFTEVFHALDYGNKGYILFDDFKNEMHKYLHKDKDSSCNNSCDEHEREFSQFLSLIVLSEDRRIYFTDFLNAVSQLNNSNSVVGDENTEENIFHNQICIHNDGNPFINDGDNNSTGDSGFDNETKTDKELKSAEIGKQNRKKIKAFQNIEISRGGETLPRRYSQNVSINWDDTDFAGNQILQKSFSNLPQEDLKSSYNGPRRRSDFVTCGMNRMSKNNRYSQEESSFNCWTPQSGSVTDLFYHDSMTDIRKKLENLEKSMDNLQVVANESKSSKRKWTDENQYLKNRIHALEDKIKSQKEEFEKRLNAEIASSRKVYKKLEQSTSDNMDILNQRLKGKEKELDTIRKEYNVLLGECEIIKYEKLRSEDKLGDFQQQMSFIEEDMQRLKDFHSRELELLNKERNRLLLNGNCLKSVSDAGQLKLQISNSSEQLQKEISNLRHENRELKSKLVCCEEEFLAFSINQGQDILKSVPLDNSWLSEIDGYSKQEMIDMLIKEKDANYRLREYVTNILTRIIERDPSLLEIT